MAVVLAYVDAVPGRLYPLVDTLLELAKRGHRVAVRCGIDDVERLRSIGLDAQSAEARDRAVRARTTGGRGRGSARSARVSASSASGRRFQLRDLEQAIEDEQPDVLFVDEGAWGAAAAAERSGLPWAFSIVSPVPLPSRDAPPFGLGLRPRHDRLGRLRDRLAKPLTLGTLERVIATHMNPLRAEIGLPPVATIEDVYLAASAVIAYTAEPFEYPRSDWPAKLSLVGPGLWEPPADPPAWSDSLDQTARARHLLDPLPERPSARRGRGDGARRRAVRGRHHDRRRRSDRPPGGAATFASSASSPTRPCSTARPASSATPVWGSRRRRSPTAFPSSPFPSGATSPRSPAGSRSHVQASDSPHGSSTPDRLRDAVRRAIELRPGAERIAGASPPPEAPPRPRMSSKH